MKKILIILFSLLFFSLSAQAKVKSKDIKFPLGVWTEKIQLCKAIGYASALNKSLIVIQNEDHQHALKEIDAAASAVASDQMQVVRILKYVLEGTLK